MSITLVRLELTSLSQLRQWSLPPSLGPSGHPLLVEARERSSNEGRRFLRGSQTSVRPSFSPSSMYIYMKNCWGGEGVQKGRKERGGAKDRWKELPAFGLARWTAVWKRNEKVCPFRGRARRRVLSFQGWKVVILTYDEKLVRFSSQ